MKLIKMGKEFNLSEKIVEEELSNDEGMCITPNKEGVFEIVKISVVRTEDIKEFIKRLKVKLCRRSDFDPKGFLCITIDKLAGEKLC